MPQHHILFGMHVCMQCRTHQIPFVVYFRSFIWILSLFFLFYLCRCIKPNNFKASDHFDEERVMEQVNSPCNLEMKEYSKGGIY